MRARRCTRTVHILATLPCSAMGITPVKEHDVTEPSAQRAWRYRGGVGSARFSYRATPRRTPAPILFPSLGQPASCATRAPRQLIRFGDKHPPPLERAGPAAFLFAWPALKREGRPPGAGGSRKDARNWCARAAALTNGTHYGPRAKNARFALPFFTIPGAHAGLAARQAGPLCQAAAGVH